MSRLDDALPRLARGATLPRLEAEAVFTEVLDGAPPVQVAGLLTAIAQRGETGDEVAGAAAAMRAAMVRLPAPDGAVDTCGTGGSGQSTRNVSTAAALVVAACGVPVAKHGSTAASSLSGSSDVLGALGVGLVPADRAASVLAEQGLVFLHAPHYHPGVGGIAPVRRALGFRTIFNVLGPLSNPAGVRRQVLGVSREAHLLLMARTLAALGATHAFVVRGADGLDELTVCGESAVIEVRGGVLTERLVTPEQAGLQRYRPGALAGGSPDENAQALLAVLGGELGAHRDAVLLNAAAALFVAGRCADLAEGARLAAAAIDEGHALAKLDAVRDATARRSWTRSFATSARRSPPPSASGPRTASCARPKPRRLRAASHER